MKRVTNKNFIQKIIIMVLIVLSFNFIIPTFSHAGFGGVLLGPVIDLIAAIPDSIIGGLQFFLLDGQYGADDHTLLGSYLVSAKEYSKGGSGNYEGWTKYPSTKYQQSSSSEPVKIYYDDLDRGWGGWAVFFWTDGDYSIPIVKYSPEKIFSGKIPALDVNFINPNINNYTTADGYTQDELDAMKDKSITAALQETIATWYNALRNLAVVGLLSVLLYVGIRMMISSTSSDKAKYKQMLMDWVIALCLLFFLHYIMSFTLTVTDMIVDGIGSTNSVAIQVIKDNGDEDVSFNTDLMGLCRMQMQYSDMGTRIIYVIMYIALVVYTFMFTWKYVKRAITMAFLTLMAPVVALTYPIDKMNDGKAQAFNMWLKEFIFNALLQPFHLIIYTIFISSAMEIAVNNPIYAILFLAFISPAEKILRKFFGFDKASTAGNAAFSGALGGAAAFNLLKGAIGKGAKGIANKSGGGSNKNPKSIRTAGGQVVDSNAPDGSMDAFVNQGQNPQLAEANTGEQGRRPEQEKETESDRLRREQAELAQLANDRDTIPYSDADREFLKQEQQRIRESDTRGIGEWAGDKLRSSWDHGKLSSVRQSRLGRTLGSGATSIRDMAAKTQEKANKIRMAGGDIIRKVPKPIRNSASGALEVARTVGKTGVKIAGRAAGAAAIGAVGLGMGIAGDDLEDVFKYGAAGAALGWTGLPAVGAGIGNSINTGAQAITTAYETRAYGEEAALLKQQAREFAASEENQQFFQADFAKKNGRDPSKKELKQIMETAAEFNNAGVTELKDIKKSMKLESEIQKQLAEAGVPEDDSAQRARQQAITISKMAKEVKPEQLRDPKKVEQLRESFVKELTSKDKSLSTKDAGVQADNVINMIKNYKKVY